jgi:hypothetical protein
MAVLYDRVFPRKVADAAAVSQLTPAQIASEIIARVQAGMAWENAETEVSSLATGQQTVTAKPFVRAVVQQLRADIRALRAVDAREYATVQEWVPALDAATVLVSRSDWIDYLQTAYDIPDGTAAERFAALKAALTPEE